MIDVVIAPHPLLEAGLLQVEWPAPLGDVASPDALVAALQLDHEAPLTRDDDVRAAVRDLLRVGGYKPTGRGKPASEYLLRAASDGKLGSINAAVDVCNAVSLHSGVPISVVDLERAEAPLSLALAAPESRFVFNASGQEIDVSGLLCVHDARGPCANAVKDSQRTKTHPGTRRTLSVLWGTTALPGRVAAAVDWYAEWLESLGAAVETHVEQAPKPT